MKARTKTLMTDAPVCRRIHGWIILDKPLGLGSTQAVSAIKRMLRASGYMGRPKVERIKVGHGGTLDPLATGVLPIALGEATKLTGRLLDASKIYEFTIAFGIETDTLDREGVAIERSDQRPTLSEIEAILANFRGPIEQAPPAYSAIKIDGRRAYDRARAGEAVEMKKRAVTVHDLRICHTEPVSAFIANPKLGLNEEWILKQVQYDEMEGKTEVCSPLDFVTLSAHVSKGTYIRSLARDIAHALGTVGHVTMLRRTRAGPFGLKEAISLDKVDEIANGAPIEAVLLPLEAGLVDIPALRLTPEQAEAVRHGGRLERIAGQDGLHLANDGDTPVALMDVEAGHARVVRGFNF